MWRGRASALLAIASALLLAPSPTTSERYRDATISTSDRLAELLREIGDGQPENIGYGYQRADIESPSLSREFLDRVVDNIILERAAEAEAPKERARPVSSFRERNRERRNFGHVRPSPALIESPNIPSDPEDPDIPSLGQVDNRVASALQELWASLPEERLPSNPTVVDELSDQDAALLLEELGRESVGDTRRSTWSSLPEEYPSVRYPTRQPLRSDHRIGRRWLQQRQEMSPEHRYMQRYRHGAMGLNPPESGKNRLSKRSPLRLATDAKVRDDLMHIFAATDTGEKQVPHNVLPSTSSTPFAANTSPATISTTTDRLSVGHAPMAPSWESNGTLHKDHENVHQHDHEQAKHAPPLLSPDGRQPFSREAPKSKGASEKLPGEEEENVPVEEPRAMEVRLHKKSVRWSDYFGIDRRRRRTPTESIAETDDDAGLLQRYLQVLFAQQAEPEVDGGPPRSLEKRVAVKKDAADVLAEESTRCPAVAPLVKDCSLAVGEFDELLPLCALHRACHLCGAIIAAWPQSCDAALRSRSAQVCGANGACMGRASRLAARISAPGGDACSRHPCLANFLTSDADTDDDPDSAVIGFGRLGTLNNNNRR